MIKMSNTVKNGQNDQKGQKYQNGKNTKSYDFAKNSTLASLAFLSRQK